MAHEEKVVIDMLIYDKKVDECRAELVGLLKPLAEKHGPDVAITAVCDQAGGGLSMLRKRGMITEDFVRRMAERFVARSKGEEVFPPAPPQKDA